MKEYTSTKKSWVCIIHSVFRKALQRSWLFLLYILIPYQKLLLFLLPLTAYCHHLYLLPVPSLDDGWVWLLAQRNYFKKKKKSLEAKVRNSSRDQFSSTTACSHLGKFIKLVTLNFNRFSGSSTTWKYTALFRTNSSYIIFMPLWKLIFCLCPLLMFVDSFYSFSIFILFDQEVSILSKFSTIMIDKTNLKPCLATIT